MENKQEIELKCSFCSKHQCEVRKLVSPDGIPTNQSILICDGCLAVCNELIGTEDKISNPDDAEMWANALKSVTISYAELLRVAGEGP